MASSKSNMWAWRLTEAVGPAGAQFGEIERPEPAPGEVRVAIRAAALNHRELWITRGQYPGMQLPCTLGCDGAGVVDAVGEGVPASLLGVAVMLYPGLRWGDDARLPAESFGLLGMPGPGTLAQYICVPVANALAKPDYLSFEESAAIPLAALTAWRGLTTKAALAAGETLLITGVGGGVATFALQIAVAMGAKALVTSGSVATLEQAQKLGATAGFNYKDEAWPKALRKAADGIDVVLDGAPATAYAGYSRSLKRGARVVIYGSTGGAQFPCTAPELFLKNLTLVGTNVGTLQELRSLLAFMEKHRIRPVIERTFALADAALALSHLERAHGMGKIVVSV
ncbi:MAG TPA: zinc-binding dehydrogenase [Steroidobacteraceae bacterium]|nr:zinc-binding dehydrogenase [Steroidobacteraceae bacterium]